MVHDVTPSMQQMFKGAPGKLGKAGQLLVKEQPRSKEKSSWQLICGEERGIGSCCLGNAGLSVSPLPSSCKRAADERKSSLGKNLVMWITLAEKGFSSLGFVRQFKVESYADILDAVSVSARNGCQGACKSMKFDHSPRYLQDCICLNVMCGT